MKFLFGTSDPTSVQDIGRKLKQAGIRFEVRAELAPRGPTLIAYSELWVPEQTDLPLERVFRTSLAAN